MHMSQVPWHAGLGLLLNGLCCCTALIAFSSTTTHTPWPGAAACWAWSVHGQQLLPLLAWRQQLVQRQTFRSPCCPASSWPLGGLLHLNVIYYWLTVRRYNARDMPIEAALAVLQDTWLAEVIQSMCRGDPKHVQR